MMSYEQVRTTLKYYPLNYAITTPYCKVCPYKDFDKICEFSIGA